MVRRKPPARGDLIKVVWLDHQENPTGNPDLATLAKRTSYGLYWDERESDGMEVLVTTTTVDEGGHTDCGWMIYGKEMVVSVEVVKRG